MKKYISLIIIPVLLLWMACSSDLEDKVVKQADPIGSISANTTEPFECNGSNLGDTAYIVSWSAADFGENITSAYMLEFDLKGNNFKTPVELHVGAKQLVKHVLSSDLNSIMHKLQQPISLPTDLEVRVVAKPMVLGSAKPQLPTVYSATNLNLNISSYAMAPNHLVGDMFNTQAWNIKNYRFAMFRDDILEVDKYVSYFVKEPSNFKIVEDTRLGDWSLTYGKGGAGILSTSGGNISDIKTAGYYTVVVNLAELTYSITPYDASGAPSYTSMTLKGSAADAEIVLTQTKYDTHMWDVDNVELKAGTLIFKSGDTSWSATSFPYGLCKSGSEAIPIEAGKYYIRFSDLSKHYIFYRK